MPVFRQSCWAAWQEFATASPSIKSQRRRKSGSSSVVSNRSSFHDIILIDPTIPLPTDILTYVESDTKLIIEMLFKIVKDSKQPNAL